MMKATRSEVYDAINSEREYQRKWEDVESKGDHEIAAFLLFMDDYLNEAKGLISRYAEEEVREDVLSTIRKVTALGVSCMEQHGAPKRDD